MARLERVIVRVLNAVARCPMCVHGFQRGTSSSTRLKLCLLLHVLQLQQITD